MIGIVVSNISDFEFQLAVQRILNIFSMISVTEVSPSTHAYSQKDYIIYDDQLYKVKSSIAVGDNLVVGVNIVLVNIGDELKAILIDDGGEVITPPTLTSATSFVYDGTSKSLSFSGYDEETMIMNSQSATNAGPHAASIALKNGNNLWSDTNNAAPKVYPWQISKAQPTITVSSNTVSVSQSARSQDITVTYTGEGTWSCSSSDPSIAIASKISSTTCRVTGISYGTTAIILSITETTNYLPAVSTIDVNSTIYRIYGIEWDGASSPVMTRTDDAVNFEDPIPQMKSDDGWTTGSSPFDNLYPWSGMIIEERDAGTMVKIPKFWFKLSINDTTHALKLQIADGPVEGFSVSPAHMDRRDGLGKRDYVYIGRYHCSSTDYKSTSGVTPKINITRSEARTAIHNLGSNIWQFDYTMLVTIWMLYLVEFANWDSQAVIGYGGAPRGSTSAVRSMGYTDSMQYHTGTDQVNRTTHGGTQYRWIEGLWDNCEDWVDGVYLSGSSVYAILDPTNFSDNSNGTWVRTKVTSGGYITAFGISSTSGFEWFMYPSATSGGSQSTYICDGYSTRSTGVALHVGGSYYYPSRDDGLFYHDSYSDNSRGYSYVGTRLIELPQTD